MNINVDLQFTWIVTGLRGGATRGCGRGGGVLVMQSMPVVSAVMVNVLMLVAVQVVAIMEFLVYKGSVFFVFVFHFFRSPHSTLT